MMSKKILDYYIDIMRTKKNNIKFTFSNKCVGIIYDMKLYIFNNNFIEKINQIHPMSIMANSTHMINDITISVMDTCLPEMRENITYMDLLNGYYSYTEQYLEGRPLNITDKFDDKDMTRKLFNSIGYFKSIPKITSGYGFIPNMIALVEVTF